MKILRLTAMIVLLALTGGVTSLLTGCNSLHEVPDDYDGYGGTGGHGGAGGHGGGGHGGGGR